MSPEKPLKKIELGEFKIDQNPLPNKSGIPIIPQK